MRIQLTQLRKLIREEFSLLRETGLDGAPEIYVIVIAAIVRGEIESSPPGFTLIDASSAPYESGNSHPIIMWKMVESEDEERVVSEASRIARSWKSQITFEEDHRSSAPSVRSGHVMVHFVNADAPVWTSNDDEGWGYLFDDVEADNGTLRDLGIPLPAPKGRRSR